MHDYQVLLDLARQNFASVVWTHKIQEKQADIYETNYKKLETINIILASLTSAGLLSLLFTESSFCFKFITTIISFFTLAITGYLKCFDLRSLVLNHKSCATNLLIIRNDMLKLIADIHLHQKSIQNLSDEFDSIMERLNKIYLEAPITTDNAVNKASIALKLKKDYTYTDEEIDCFLPRELKGKIRE